MSHFRDLGLAEALLRAVSAEGYTTPTPIQAEAIPALLTGRDLVGIAQTGTGKTAAFVLPVLHRIAQGATAPGARRCTALVLAPTRELAAQIRDSVHTYGRFVRHSAALVVGGVTPGPQVRSMAPGVDVLVATPGRLLDHMSTGAVRLDGTTVVVLDEADQMLDLGFLPAIRRILAKLPAERQTVLLSATMPPPIRALAGDFLTDPAEIAVTPVSRPVDRIDQSVVHVDSTAKRGVLVGLLGASAVERAIVFTRTKRGADKVALHLQKAGLPAAAIHGNKSQGQRQRTLSEFRAGRSTILVATDIAARGIDVDDVSHVINYELPNVPEAYVHRIGRTARAGKGGTAVSLCDHSERGLLRDIERLIARPIARSAMAPQGDGAGDARAVIARAAPGTAVDGRRPPADRPAADTSGAGAPRARPGPNGQKRRRNRPGRGPVAAARPTPDEAPDGGLHRMLGAAGARQRPARARQSAGNRSPHGE